MQTQEVTWLQEQGIEDVYIELLKEISSMTVHIYKESDMINISPSCLRQNSKAYSDDWLEKQEAYR